MFLKLIHMKQELISIFSWALALLFSAIGLINCFIGNDPEFGIFILLISLFFYPPLQFAMEKKKGWVIPKAALFIVAIFILWSSLGVGELANKIQELLLMI